MSKTAAELIAHLEAGGLIVKGEPNHPTFLRFEIYGENRVKYLGCYGWGSALVTAGDRLIDVVENPHKWICLPTVTSIPDAETVAKPLLEKIGHYEDYEWQLTVEDERRANGPKKP